MTTLRQIRAEAAERHGLTVDEIMSRNAPTERRINAARQEAWRLSERAGYTVSQIGRLWGRDHSTVAHGIRQAKKRASK